MIISAVVLTKNSSKTIESCLKSVSWCDEIIVVDDNSIDDTIALAKKNGAIVYSHDLSNDFSSQRNFGLEKAKGGWVFFIDSDEVISSSLREEIESRIKNQESRINGYYIHRIDTMWGKEMKYGELGDIWLLRLGKKDQGKWKGRVHETWEIEGPVEQFKNVLFHYPHPTISEFLRKINFYSTLRAKELFEKKVQVHWWDIILYPKAKFWLNYIGKLGCLDGTPGFLVAIIMSFHSFLVRGKVWQLQNHNS